MAGQSLLPAGLSSVLTLPSLALFFLIVCQVFLCLERGWQGTWTCILMQVGFGPCGGEVV